MSSPDHKSDRNFLDPQPESGLEPDRSRDESLPFLERADSPPKRESNGCRNVMIGCGCLFFVVLGIMVAVGIWAARNWKNLVADISKKVATDAIEQSSLPQADKDRILKRLDGLAEDFKSGKLSPEQAGRVMGEIAESPLLPLGMVMAVEHQYLKPSGLTEEEKEAARRTLQRFARGAFEKKIAQTDVQEVMKLVTEKGPGGQERLKQKLTDAELKAALEKALDSADAAAIPDEPFEVNVADELERAIDRALNPQATPEPDPEPNEPEKPVEPEPNQAN